MTSRALLALLLTVGALAACAQDAPTVSFDARISRAGEIVRVDAVTDLPDGAQFSYSITSGTGPDTPLGAPVVSGQAATIDGRLAFAADVSALWSGPTSVWIAFTPGPQQPGNVTNVVGLDGEHLRGEQVVDDDGVNRLVWEGQFELP